MAWRIGIDTGGTFTDLALVDDATGACHLYKLASTPADLSEAIVAGLMEVLRRAGAAPSALAALGHGTTVATNAVIEGKLASTGLITTRGFRDVIEIARQRRPDLYDLDKTKPHPIVSREHRREIGERLACDGSVLQPVDEAEVEAIVKDFGEAGMAAVAICLLHAYANPAHEEVVEKTVRRMRPDLAVSRSSAVLPEFREYERFSTTILNAALRPVVSRYLEKLTEQVAARGVPVLPRIMQSNGGVMSVAAAAERPVATLFSGPSAGVIGAVVAAAAAGRRDLITFDMGGTSTDVCLIRDGRPALTLQREIGGRPVKTPMLDVHSIGAGGGSIGWIDRGGFMKVGPQSAGARPGPASYGLGGAEPTVTDANLILGRLDPESPLAGTMRLNAEAAREAIRARVADPLKISVVDAALGMLRIVNANMVRAIRVVSVEKGYDPRDFVLVAFGGAGPMQAAHLAKDLRIGRVFVPGSPGILCAMGLLFADVRADFGRTALMKRQVASPARINDLFADLEAEALRWLEREHLPGEEAILERRVDMRYVGQDYELPVPAPAGALAEPDLARLETAFHEAHAHAYGYSASDAPTELVNFRVVLRVPAHPPRPAPRESGGPDPSAARRAVRPVYFKEAGEFVDCPVYDRPRLHPGNLIPGPAIVEQMDATTVILPGQHADVDPWGNLMVTPDLAR